MQVKKRNGKLEEFNINKVWEALRGAFNSCSKAVPYSVYKDIEKEITNTKKSIIDVEEVQDIIENYLINRRYNQVAKRFIIYREQHKQSRFIKERIDYMNRYVDSDENASTCSETDANANVSLKNVANLEGEVYKTTNRLIQRQRMKEKLTEMFPEVSKEYEKDLNSHIIYCHDESSSPALKQYCLAASMYPMMLEGIGNIDGVTPTPPNDIASFSGQVTNLVFLLSSQVKGAVALSEYFIAYNYYIVKEFGEEWYKSLDSVISTDICKNKRTIQHAILKGFKQFVWGINQVAGNRSYQSPFTNISYFDSIYFKSLFQDFIYPDGTKPEWEAIDTLQRLFMNWFNEIRLTQVLTFPVETFAMVHDGKDIIDQSYKNLCAEVYSKGHSFFTYISDSADSLSSCCRLKNELSENTFNPTSGLTGVMTGSCNVITLNINRLVQDAILGSPTGNPLDENKYLSNKEKYKNKIKEHLKTILNRVYKYHIAYKTMLYDMEDKGMFSSSTGGYIYINKLYSTIGINGLNEAARFLGLKVSNNDDYIEFLQLILKTIKECNKEHSINDTKRPFIFNSEVVPAEGLGSKNYQWDKESGYYVPEDKNLYNSYFYDAHDNTTIIDKFILHGKKTYEYTDGGSALHVNMDSHLSKEQYLKLIDFAIEQGTNYFTFNVPNSKCEDCKHIVKQPVSECPKCSSKNITQYTRVIGFMRPIPSFSAERQIEANNRYYNNGVLEV